MTNIAQTKETAKFLNLAHRLWVSDFGEMNDYMTCLNALMSDYGVQWKSVVELDSENLNKAISHGFETENLFEYEVNDNSKDKFENFIAVCESMMDFSKMYSLTKTAA